MCFFLSFFPNNQPLPRSATITLLHAQDSFTPTQELQNSLPAAPAMWRLPLRLLPSAALRSPTLSRAGSPVPRPPHLPAAEPVRWLPQRGYSRFASGFTPLEPKKLGSILDVERAKGLSPEHLVAAWDDYHLGRGHIGVSMKAKLYRLLEQRSATCPYFVIPLWRGSGYTTMFMQVQLPHMILTGLEDYKARGTEASPYYTVTHFRVCRNQGYGACPRRRRLHQQTNRCRGEASFRDGALLVPERCAVQARGAFQQGNT